MRCCRGQALQFARCTNALHVLVVEDDAFAAKVMSRMVSEVAPEITVARDGREALDIIASKPKHYFSCVITDLLMPRMGGFGTERSSSKSVLAAFSLLF